MFGEQTKLMNGQYNAIDENSNGVVNKGIEDRFNAAVNVIRGLPKNGKYKN